MPVLPFDDLDVFIDDFAITARLCLQNGAVRVISGIFDEPYLNAELGEYEADTQRTRFTCKESDVVGVTRGDTVTIESIVYDVLTTYQPDGTGMAQLELARQ